MRQPDTDERPTPGGEPAEGRPDLDLPGADQDDPLAERAPGDTPDSGPGSGPNRDLPDTPDADLPERLGERIENGPGSGIAAGEPDLVPDVEVPEETM
jgi:hypothetical protein